MIEYDEDYEDTEAYEDYEEVLVEVQNVQEDGSPSVVPTENMVEDAINEDIPMRSETNDDNPGFSSNRKRKSFTAKFKLRVLSEYVPNSRGQGFAALGKKYNIDASVIRRWYHQKQKIKENKTRHTIHESRRLAGGGRKAQYGELEKHLIDWIQSRNAKGLQVSKCHRNL